MRIDQGFPVFYGKDGNLLKSGKVYIGEVNEDAETHLVDLFWDAALTQAATNPFSVRNGIIVKRGQPVSIFTAEEFSITIRDDMGVLQFSSPNACAVPSADVLDTLTPVLDQYYVKKSGDVMTGPLAIADAVGPNDLYSRIQLDQLLAFRVSATFVIDSAAKWNAFVTNTPGNDYTDVLIKRGTWHVVAGIIPPSCKRLRGEYGAELFFDSSDASSYCITVPDGQQTELMDFVVTAQISGSVALNNTAKTVLVGRDADIHNLFIVFSLSGNVASANLVGVTCARARDIVLNMISETADIVAQTSLALTCCQLIASSYGTLTVAENIIVADNAPIFSAIGRNLQLNSAISMSVVLVKTAAGIPANVVWRAPLYNVVGLKVPVKVTMTLMIVGGNAGACSILSIRGGFTFRLPIIDLRIMDWSGTDSKVTADYAANFIFDSQSASFKQGFAAPLPNISNTGSGLMSVKGALAVYAATGGATISCKDVIFGAFVVEAVVTLAGIDLGADYAVRLCRHVRNCSVTVPAGSKYAPDVYTSSDNTVPVAATAAGGWNT